MMKSFLCLLLLLCSCSPNSSTDFQHEGEARCRALTKELQKIENREQLLRAEAQLKKHFEALVDLMIAAREFQGDHLDDVPQEAAFEENSAEIVLEEELRRIYAIEGGREVVERSQHEGLVRLDGYEKTLAKRKAKFKPAGK
jgi:hypothetical protein